MNIPLNADGTVDVTQAIVEAFPNGWDGPKREILVQWPIDGQSAGSIGRHIVFEVDHYSKMLRAEVYIITVTDSRGSYQRAMGIGLSGGDCSSETIKREPVARYSKKALQAMYDDVVASPELVAALQRVLEAAGSVAA